MSDTPLISLRNIHVQFGLKVLFHDVTLNVYPKDRIALVGRNGSGKTTLFKTLMNHIELTRGRFSFNRGLRLAICHKKWIGSLDKRH